jgi:hypothetical protein
MSACGTRYVLARKGRTGEAAHSSVPPRRPARTVRVGEHLRETSHPRRASRVAPARARRRRHAVAQNLGSGRDLRESPIPPVLAHTPPAPTGSNRASGREERGERSPRSNGDVRGLGAPAGARVRAPPATTGANSRAGSTRARRARRHAATRRELIAGDKHPRLRAANARRRCLDHVTSVGCHPLSIAGSDSPQTLQLPVDDRIAIVRFPRPTAGSRSVRNTGNARASQQSAAACLRRP